jgi:hypothetical protein
MSSQQFLKNELFLLRSSPLYRSGDKSDLGLSPPFINQEQLNIKTIVCKGEHMMKIIKNIGAIFFLSMALVFTGVAHPDGDFFQRRDNKPRERPKEGGGKKGDRDKGKPRDGKKGDKRRP